LTQSPFRGSNQNIFFRMKQITILIVDDHPLIRKAWGFLINQDARFKVIGECECGEVAVELTRQLRPDIVIMDIGLHGASGIEATQMIRKYSPESRIIGQSFHVRADYIQKMIQCGAMGFLTKNSPLEEIIKAIIEVQNGRVYLCHEVKNVLASL
jgi:DNA-binding NarL/FixJ family response regulator